MPDFSSLDNRVIASIKAAVSHAGDVSDGLDALLEQTGARASGLWRCHIDRLMLIGFRAVADMPNEVRRGFVSATESVPLTETGLGIVKAVITRKSAMAYLDPGDSGLRASAGWLGRFECVQSLAVPILCAADIEGVIAISTPLELVPESEAWQMMLHVGERLAGVFS